MKVTQQLKPSAAFPKIPSLSHLIITWELYTEKKRWKVLKQILYTIPQIHKIILTHEKCKRGQKKLNDFLPL